MKIGVNFSPLQDLVHQMRARRSKWSLAPYVPPPVRELRRKLSTGIEAQIAEVKPGPGRLLTFKGEQVLLYIKETRQSKYILQNFPEDARRFHIYECATIGQMRRSNRFERYVVTTRQGGLFAVNDLKGDEIEARLRVCKTVFGVSTGRTTAQIGMRRSRMSYGCNSTCATFPDIRDVFPDITQTLGSNVAPRRLRLWMVSQIRLCEKETKLAMRRVPC